MFGEDSGDVTKELAIFQLIEKTELCENNMWLRDNHTTYIQYYFEQDITEKQKIHFRLTHYLTHDAHTLNIYISKNRGSIQIPLMVAIGNDVLPLIKAIEKTKKYHYPGGKP